ncbi:MAG: hypothetical protein NTV48_00680 [Candidatus Vogelbacteria bacterium]|nr:hypothetical protein [Candidatus Vogelbacteria bacterium]
MISKKHSFGLLSKNETKGLTQTEEVVDDKKRSFLKTLGIVGAGALAFSILPKKVQALSFGGGGIVGKVKIKNSSNTQVDPLTNSTLATTKSKFDSVHTKTAGIISDTASIITNTANVPTLGSYGSMAGSTSVAIASDQPTVPLKGYGTFSTANLTATDNDSLWYLRKINKQLECLSTTDNTASTGGKRQRIVVDAPVDNTIPTMDMAQSAGAAQTSTNGYGMQMYQDIARNAYANSIRRKLIFH